MRWFEEVVYQRLGRDRWGDGQPGAPGDGLSIRVGPIDGHPDGVFKPIYTVQTSNDGFDLWIGTDTEWCWSCVWFDARRVAWFVFWDWWVIGTWCGLRRRLWFWALCRRVERVPSPLDNVSPCSVGDKT